MPSNSCALHLDWGVAFFLLFLLARRRGLKSFVLPTVVVMEDVTTNAVKIEMALEKEGMAFVWAEKKKQMILYCKKKIDAKESSIVFHAMI